MKFFLIISIILTWSVPGLHLLAQTGYDPHKAFDPGFDAGSKTDYRSSNGMPGPAYWQNRADYSIDASLDESAKVISATVRITYTNNSPDSLPYVWLALDQNNFGPTSRSARSSPAPSKFSGGFVIQRVEIQLHGKK